MRRFARSATLCAAPFAAWLLASAACAQEARVARLRADLLAAASATQLLTERCAELRLAVPAVIHAQLVPLADEAVAADVRARLRVGGDETVRHRRVRLTCGAHVLSEADNWYVPSRLTPAMNRSLDETDTPFGSVVRPLGFHRRIMEIVQSGGNDTVLTVTALLLTAQETPISLVIENYRGLLLADPKP